jgi:EAL domain-containing protein (putative c-di-GMP-specific phosphodiesterase class I)
MRAEDMMRQADIALYEAKAGGRGKYQLFANDLDEAVQEKRALEIDLREALANGQGLELVYQPIFDTRTANIAGAEALVRWQHPTRGRLSPAMFITLAEERGLIDELGMWVMRTACRFAASSAVPWVAVNVSPIQFRDDHFAEKVFEVLAEAGLPAKRLEIEITEGLLLQNSPAIQSTLMLLRAKGIRVALDDFGTGYSSISYLRNHGVDKLKIDQSFTAQLGLDEEIDSIVRSIIDLGRAMHMLVTAEGVETDDQRVLLNSMGCDQLQGFLLSRPVTPEKLEMTLRANICGAQGTSHGGTRAL